jgi:CBS domain-containing protein
MMRTRDIMTCPVHTVRDTDVIDDVATVLAEHAITATPVLDTGGDLVGMVSEGDLLRYRIGAPAEAGRCTTAGEVMNRHVVSVSPYAEVGEVAAAMLNQSVHTLPVLDDGQLVGIVSPSDLLRTLVTCDDLVRREIQRRLDAYADGSQRWWVRVDNGTVLIGGEFADEVERKVVAILAGAVTGVLEVIVSQPPGELRACG